MTTQSEKIYEQAKNIIPGGVSSPVRAIKPYPFYTASAGGCTITDADGNRYIDYCMGYGPLILGHAHPAIKDAVIDQLSRGWLYGTPRSRRRCGLQQRSHPSIRVSICCGSSHPGQRRP